MTTQSDLTINPSPRHEGQAQEDFEALSSLQKRWQNIRLQEIQRQLRLYTDLNFTICTDKPFIQSESIIYIPEETLTLPVEAIAAIAAHYWCQRATYPTLSSLYPNIDFMTTYAFVSAFLVRYHYPIHKVLLHCIKSSNEEINESLKGLSKQLIGLVVAYQQAKANRQGTENSCSIHPLRTNKFKRRLSRRHPMPVM